MSERPDDTFGIRDSFAAAALTGLTANSMVNGVEDAVSRQAYALADAMIQVRKTSQPPVEPTEPVDPETEPPARKR